MGAMPFGKLPQGVSDYFGALEQKMGPVGTFLGGMAKGPEGLGTFLGGGRNGKPSIFNPRPGGAL